MIRAQHVLIDFENVQPSTLQLLRGEHVRVMVFVGEGQNKISLELADSMQQLGLNASYVRMSGRGRNALDFHIAFYIGQLSAADPHAAYHIVSRDTGFDPLVTHLRSKQIQCQRWADLAELPFLRLAAVQSCDDRLKLIVDRLEKLGSSCPRSTKTLASSITAIFQGKVAEADVSDLIKELEARRFIEVAEGKVAYGRGLAFV